MGCHGKVSKGIGDPKSIFFKEFVMTLLASTPVCHKKKKINLIFVIFDVLFVEPRQIASLKGFLWMNNRPYLDISFCN